MTGRMRRLTALIVLGCILAAACIGIWLISVVGFGSGTAGWSLKSMATALRIYTCFNSQKASQYFLDCARDGMIGQADALLRKGADLYARDSLGNSALHLAAAANQVYMITHLGAKGVDVHLRNDAQYTPLHTAAEAGQVEAATALLALGANPTEMTQDSTMTMPLFLAAKAKQWDIVRLLTPITHGNYDLNIAASFGDIAYIQEILEENPGLINLYTDGLKGGGFTAMFYAIMAGEIEVVEYLHQKGAALECTEGQSGQLIINLIATKGDDNMIRKVVALGCDVNLRTPRSGGQSALFTQSEKGRTQTVALLLELGALPELPDNNGDTPLHAAAAGNHGETAALLLVHGAAVNAANRNKRTPLHAAAEKGHAAMAAQLIAAGGDTAARDRHGKTPEDLAREGGQAAIIKVFERAARSLQEGE